MYKSVPLSQLKPNPYRRLSEYAIQREKVDALKESIGATGFWGNIVARPSSNGFEIAYGHHRLVALQESLSKNAKVDVIVRKLSNEQMIQMMARENMEEYGTSAWVELETIRSVIAAYGSGDIELPKVPKDTRKDAIRNVCQPSGIGHPYTTATVAAFLGWTREANNGNTVRPNSACETAFRALDMIDQGFIKESDLKGLKRDQMRTLIEGQWMIYQANLRRAEAKREDAEWVKKSAEETTDPQQRKAKERKAAVLLAEAETTEKKAVLDAKAFGKDAAKAIRSGEIGVREAIKMAEQRKPGAARQSAPDVDGLAKKTIALIDRFGNGDDQVSANLEAIRKFSEELSDASASALVRSINNAIKRLEKLSVRMECLV